MVLCPKARKSRSPPGFAAGALTQTDRLKPIHDDKDMAQPALNGAGWSSPVARQAHNLKVVGSNPTPATI